MGAPRHARDPSQRVQVLSEDGRVLDDATVPDVDGETLRSMYADMRLSRRFDERVISLQRQGRMGTYPSLAGQEGAQIGSIYAMRGGDWSIYQYREHGLAAVHGHLPALVRYWMGHEEGNAELAAANVFPINICIGSHLPHAVGMAWASALSGEERAFVCHFGDGATSEGDFHEALNFAGVFDVPTVFLCHNNQWAISVPREKQTASETIAQKATAYGFEGVQVDGMDPLAVYQVTGEAIDRAANPSGDEPRPTLIEAVQYRYGAHTTADDPSVYRDDEEVERWRRKDPIDRLEAYLRDRGLLDDETIETIEAGIEETVAAAVEAGEATEADPDDMFDHVYGTLPPNLVEQREWLRGLRERHGDDALLREE